MADGNDKKMSNIDIPPDISAIPNQKNDKNHNISEETAKRPSVAELAKTLNLDFSPDNPYFMANRREHLIRFNVPLNKKENKKNDDKDTK